MRNLKWIIVLFAAAAMGTLIFPGCYKAPVKSDVEVQKGQVLNPGDTVYLFHSGTDEVKKIICVGETIPVYDEVYAKGVTKRTEVGKVQVLEYAGEHQFKARVVEGKIKNGNVAVKENAACMVYTNDAQ